MNRHGEYKVPGGKLVVVNFLVEAGRLTRMRVTGDFFLYPDEALHVLNAALEGAACDAEPTVWTQLITAALPENAELLGFGPADVAEAIRRALV